MMSNDLKEYLQAPVDSKRAVLKKLYLANEPRGTLERDRALHHLLYLVEYTRRLNMVECKSGDQPIMKPSAVRMTHLFVCVELCAESIHDNALLQTNAEFQLGWIPFMELLARLKSEGGSEKFFEAAFLLLYLAASVFRRHIADNAVEKKPEILSIEGYATLAAEWVDPLFELASSPSEQMKILANSLKRFGA